MPASFPFLLCAKILKKVLDKQPAFPYNIICLLQV